MPSALGLNPQAKAPEHDDASVFDVNGFAVRAVIARSATPQPEGSYPGKAVYVINVNEGLVTSYSFPTPAHGTARVEPGRADITFPASTYEDGPPLIRPVFASPGTHEHSASGHVFVVPC